MVWGTAKPSRLSAAALCGVLDRRGVCTGIRGSVGAQRFQVILTDGGKGEVA